MAFGHDSSMGHCISKIVADIELKSTHLSPAILTILMSLYLREKSYETLKFKTSTTFNRISNMGSSKCGFSADTQCYGDELLRASAIRCAPPTLTTKWPGRGGTSRQAPP